MDDRTHAERPTTSSHAALSGDDRLAGSGTRPLSKSRYDGINYYIGARADTATFNDMPIAMDQEHFERLVHAELIACLRAMLLICSPVIHLLYVQTASRLMMVMMSIAGKTCKLRSSSTAGRVLSLSRWRCESPSVRDQEQHQDSSSGRPRISEVLLHEYQPGISSLASTAL